MDSSIKEVPQASCAECEYVFDGPEDETEREIFCSAYCVMVYKTKDSLWGVAGNPKVEQKSLRPKRIKK